MLRAMRTLCLWVNSGMEFLLLVSRQVHILHLEVERLQAFCAVVESRKAVGVVGYRLAAVGTLVTDVADFGEGIEKRCLHNGALC